MVCTYDFSGNCRAIRLCKPEIFEYRGFSPRITANSRDRELSLPQFALFVLFLPRLLRYTHDAKGHEDEELKTEAHNLLGTNAGKNTIKALRVARQLTNSTRCVLLHPSLTFHDTQYYIRLIAFVMIFTNTCGYMYIAQRRNNEYDA